MMNKVASTTAAEFAKLGTHPAPGGAAGDQEHGAAASQEGLSDAALASAAEADRARVITTLAEFPSKTILDEIALAKALQVCRRTISNMVSRNELPPPVPFAGRPSWMVSKVLDHYEFRADEAAREAERAARKLRSLTG